jgi:hypothetical protein
MRLCIWTGDSEETSRLFSVIQFCGLKKARYYGDGVEVLMYLHVRPGLLNNILAEGHPILTAKQLIVPLREAKESSLRIQWNAITLYYSQYNGLACP